MDLSQTLITITYDYFENYIQLQIITDYDYPRSGFNSEMSAALEFLRPPLKRPLNVKKINRPIRFVLTSIDHLWGILTGMGGLTS